MCVATENMSGRIIGPTTVKNHNTQKPSTAMKSAATPPPLPPSRVGSTSSSHSLSMKAAFCPKCGPTDPCVHLYEDLNAKQTDTELGQYEFLTSSSDAIDKQISDRLRKVEDNQMRLRSEFNDFRESIQESIKSLHSSVRRVIEMNEALDESMRESFAYLQSNMEKTHQQLLESSDHLGKQILDVRRDFMSSSKNQSSTTRPTNSDLDRQKRSIYAHILEWEVSNIDRLLSLQQNATSQSHLIGQVDFKILGGVVGTKDGRLQIKVHGSFTHMPIEAKERKNGDFECSVFLVDKSGKRGEWLVGKITGNFNTGQEWIVGNVSVAEIKMRGYATSTGNVNLKYVINVTG